MLEPGGVSLRGVAVTKTGVPVEVVGEGGMSVCAFREGYSSGSTAVRSLSRARLATILEVGSEL